MSAHIGARELRQNLSAVLKRVEKGERLIVTSHNVPVAELRPLVPQNSALQRLIEEGRASPATRELDFTPIRLEDAREYALSEALEYVRGED